MARTSVEMLRWIEETLSISRDLYNLAIRADKLRSKTASGGYFTEPAPVEHLGAPIAEIRGCFNACVVDLTNMMLGNTQVGAADRKSAYWQADPGSGI